MLILTNVHVSTENKRTPLNSISLLRLSVIHLRQLLNISPLYLLHHGLVFSNLYHVAVCSVRFHGPSHLQ